MRYLTRLFILAFLITLKVLGWAHDETEKETSNNRPNKSSIRSYHSRDDSRLHNEQEQSSFGD